MKNTILEGYADASEELIPRFESISTDELFRPVLHLLPDGPLKVADVGTGTGRDAAWFANRGQMVLAIEPVKELREAGKRLHPSPNIEWLDYALPALSHTLARKETFDLIILSGVWQHLDAHQRCEAMPKLCKLMKPAATLVISVRNGPGAATRPVFPGKADETIALARAAGLHLTFRQAAASLQAGNKAANVSWDWLVFSTD